MKPIKPKRCAVCHNEFIPSLTTQKVCGLHCAIKLSQIKEKEKRDKASSKDLREFNKLDLKWQHKLTQRSFNRMRVLQELRWYEGRDLLPRCISCQKTLGGDQWCCGHFKTTHNSLLRYDPANTFLQHNHHCNMNLSGDISGTEKTMGYKKGLVVRFGADKGNEIIDYCDNANAVKKWTWQELESMRKQFNATIRELSC